MSDSRVASFHRAYREYLALDTLLTLQQPNTGHTDELLFVIVHQTHELWFKEILHELCELRTALSGKAHGPALRTLRRLRAIVKLLVAQIDVLETLTPEQFGGFRDRLGGSGFYSAQYWEIEVMLGRSGDVAAGFFPQDSEDRRRIAARASQTTLLEAFAQYLSVARYSPAAMGSALREASLRDGVEAQVSDGMLDLDQAFQEWRFRHAVLARRVIGDETGTGGSTGAEYLRRAVFEPSFPDLWHVAGRM
jgi:tryptophan 2,3-dioxygenase